VYDIGRRIKNTYSLHKKMERYKREGRDVDEIHDILALRIITDNIESCYKILGLVNNRWRPVPNSVRDYIATPKPNGYQSLHTSIYSGDGTIAEVQIRTKEMHDEAEFGIASHVAYYESNKSKNTKALKRRLSWIYDILDQQRGTDDSDAFAENLRIDFFADRIFVFTPKGDVIDLPEGATALDFAFRIHSRIGEQAVAAVIDEKYCRLNAKLESGQVVRIETRKNEKPNKKWLDFAVTPLARRRIRSWFKR
jgi:GTP diphosphokinase / guanosine-3',5'-bis(diphosphate) 3'-diphosphatase